MSSPCFVNLRSDVGFKAVFADKNNKDILIGVLNQILPPEARIEDIKEYSDRESREGCPLREKTVLDLVCVDKDAGTFIVEMQAAEEDFFFRKVRLLRVGLYHLELSDGNGTRGCVPYVVSFLNYRLKHVDESFGTPTTLSRIEVLGKTHRNGCGSDKKCYLCGDGTVHQDAGGVRDGVRQAVLHIQEQWWLQRILNGLRGRPRWIAEAWRWRSSRRRNLNTRLTR